MSQEDYFSSLEDGLNEVWEIASEARKKGEDPEDEIEIKRSEDMAERTEMFLEIDGLAERIRELTDEDMGREDMAFKLTDEFLNDNIGEFDNPQEKIDASIRTALAILTEAVVAAPLEGLQEVTTETDSEGREYIRIRYGGPIRSAGGTAQVVSVIIADYCRQYYEFDKFVPTDDEVERYVEEKDLYDREVGLQYTPSDDEVRTIIQNTPVMLDAEAVTEGEVSGYRDLERIPTNGGRGGMCLVAFEGIAQKVPKLQKYTEELGLDGWEWLTELPNASKAKSEDEGEDNNDENDDEEQETDHSEEETDKMLTEKVKPKSKYIDDTLTAGRPIFAHPSKPGGFRLRYGRSRNTGHAAGGISPATMVILHNYIAPGTQLKTERPGKAIAAAPVESLEGPTVKLENGKVFRIDDENEAEKYRNQVEKILDLGEIGMPYGEFLENNAKLLPSSYVHEWWAQEASNAGLPAENLNPESLNSAQAWNMAKSHDIPLHPKFTYLWHDISLDEYKELATKIENKNTNEDESLTLTDEISNQLETLLIEHTHNKEEQTVTIPEKHTQTLKNCCDPTATKDANNTMQAVNTASPVEIRERAPVRIGSRMGRPEKAEKRTFKRDLDIHSLFPVGDGVNRHIPEAATQDNTKNSLLGKQKEKPDKMDNLPEGQIPSQLATRKCNTCGNTTPRIKCCNERTTPIAACTKCGHTYKLQTEDMGEKECPECSTQNTANKIQTNNIKNRLHEAYETLGEREGSFEELKGVEGLVSQEKIPEPLEKGVLRAKHNVSVYKDGTARYDATNLPLTSFKPAHVNAPIDKLKELGYKTDIHGEPLENPQQTVELKMQDIIVPQKSADFLLNVANYIDELLQNYYETEPHYNATKPEDMIGKLIIGMAPHTSAGALGRIVGYTDAWAQYAHPFFHAAKRRNCFHPNEKLHYQVNDEWKYGTIQNLVEQHLDKNNLETDDYGSEYSDPKKNIKVPSLDDQGNQTLKPLNKVQRNPAPDHMVTFKTETGREITVTPDHGMLVYENGEQKKVPARDVSEGDQLLEPKHLDTITGNKPKTYDLLKELATTDNVNNSKLTITNLSEEQVKQLYEQAFGVNTNGNYLAELRDKLNKSKKTISNYVYRGTIPTKFLLHGFENVEELCKAVPDDAELGWKRNPVTANRFVELDETLATFLGYYAAEGFTRDQDGGAFQTTISATENEVRDFALNAFNECFGVEAYEQNERKITASSAIVQQAMKYVFDAENYSHKKNVPECIMTTSDDHLINNFLGGYLSGDGGFSSNSVCVGTTVSSVLRDDIISLLDRLGVESEVKTIEPSDLHEKFPDYYEPGEKDSRESYNIIIRPVNVTKFSEVCTIHLNRKQQSMENILDKNRTGIRSLKSHGETNVVDIVNKTIKESDIDKTYNIEVEKTNTLEIGRIMSANCDSDEDAFMLALDGLLNYSEHFLNHHKSGWSMDEPIVMSKRIDPTEIDDEAHNVDIASSYPLEFYEATLEGVGPKEVDIEIAEDKLDDPVGFEHSLDSDRVDGGPEITEYKTLPDMDAKIDAQFDISQKARAVDENDVAERVIDGHFMADLKGNLRAFGEQSVRCTSCHHNHRRPPLDGVCKKCGEDSAWTINVHEGSVTKYLENMKDMSDTYEVSDYLKQIIDEYDRSVESLFEDDTDKQIGLGEFCD